jgi:hypothetical protein
MNLRDNLPLFYFDLANNQMGDSKHVKLLLIFFMAWITLTIRHITHLRRSTVITTCVRISGYFNPRILGLPGMERFSLATELVLSEAERRVLIF